MAPDRRVGAAARRVRWRERLFGLARPFLPEGGASWNAGALVLLYHRVSASEPHDDPFAVSLRAFEEQVAWLAQRYSLVTVDELVARIGRGESTALAAITFDDGYDCTVSRALPVLRSRGAVATVFVDTGRLNTGGSALSDADVRQLADSGIEIGSHSVSHAELPELDALALDRELRDSRARLEQIIGRPVHGFAHPFGRYDGRVKEAVRRAGYAYACTCRQNETNPPAGDPFEVARIEINSTDNHERFVSKVRGRYAPLYSAWYQLQPSTRAWGRGDR